MTHTRRTRMLGQDHTAGPCITDHKGYCGCPLELAEDDSTCDVICSDVGPVTMQCDPWLADSVTYEGHMPVIDLDLPCRLVPSATEGHFHLYIDKVIPFENYVRILYQMASAGIVQWGFHDATVERGFGSVRHPDRPKET